MDPGAFSCPRARVQAGKRRTSRSARGQERRPGSRQVQGPATSNALPSTTLRNSTVLAKRPLLPGAAPARGPRHPGSQPSLPLGWPSHARAGAPGPGRRPRSSWSSLLPSFSFLFLRTRSARLPTPQSVLNKSPVITPALRKLQDACGFGEGLYLCRHSSHSNTNIDSLPPRVTNSRWLCRASNHRYLSFRNIFSKPPGRTYTKVFSAAALSLGKQRLGTLLFQNTDCFFFSASPQPLTIHGCLEQANSKHLNCCLFLTGGPRSLTRI